MAIKGKGRARSGQRTVTRAPRPGYVEPPKPFYQRRWVRWTALGIVVVGVIAIVLSLWFIHLSNNHKKAVAAEAHDKQAAVQAYTLRLNAYLQDVAQPLGGGTQVAAFQDLPTKLADLKSGSLSAADATDYAKQVVGGASATARLVEKMDVPKLVDTERFPDLLDLQDSQSLIARAFRVYAQAGQALLNAASATGDQQAEFIKQGQALATIAAGMFSDGYQKAVNQQIATGAPVNPFPAPGPSPTPSVSPTPPASPSAPASPKPSASASAKPKPSGSAGGGSGKGSGGGKNGAGSGKHTPKPTPSAS